MNLTNALNIDGKQDFCDLIAIATLAFFGSLNCGSGTEDFQYFINIAAEPWAHDEQDGSVRLGAVLATDAPPGHEFEIEFFWDEGKGERFPIPEEFLQSEVGSSLADDGESSELTEAGTIVGPGRVRYIFSRRVELFAVRLKMREVPSAVEFCEPYRVGFRLLGFEGFKHNSARLESGYSRMWYPNVGEGGVNLEMNIGQERFVAQPGSIEEVEFTFDGHPRDMAFLARTDIGGSYVRRQIVSPDGYRFSNESASSGEGRARLAASAIADMASEGIDVLKGFCHAWAHSDERCMLSHVPADVQPGLPESVEDHAFLIKSREGVSALSFQISLEDVEGP